MVDGAPFDELISGQSVNVDLELGLSSMLSVGEDLEAHTKPPFSRLRG